MWYRVQIYIFCHLLILKRIGRVTRGKHVVKQSSLGGGEGLAGAKTVADRRRPQKPLELFGVILHINTYFVL